MHVETHVSVYVCKTEDRTLIMTSGCIFVKS